MLSRLAAAWRILIQRLAADWLILAAAVVTVVLATVLLASGPIYADAVTLSALQRSLTDAPVADANVEVSRRTPPEQYQLTDQIATQEIEETFTTTGVDVLRHIETDPFELAIQSPDGLVTLASFEYLEDVSSHATLLEGAWPKDTGSTVETSLLASAADQLGVVVGDVLATTNRLDDQHHAVVKIVGTYEIDDPMDSFWFDDVLPFEGVTESPSFRTYGPFAVTQESMANNLAGNRLETSWRAFPHYENLEVEEVGQLRGRVFSLEERLNMTLAEQTANDPAPTSEFSVDTGLVSLLGETQRSLTVTRSSVLALLVQLAILAGYALVLTAGLLVGARRTETNLLRSRGASPKQVGLLAAIEGVLLTLPAALAAPWLASAALGLLNEVGPLSPVGLTIDPKPTVEAYVLAGIAAAGAVYALSWPAFQSAKRFPDSNREERQRGRSSAQRAGIDFALLALTVVVFWQLQNLGPQISATIRGRFGIDPLLVVAPALGLLAGAVLALRVIPLMARIAERIAAGSRWTVSALSAWQVARRPVRYARSALLLIMAIGIGFYAASFTTTWVQSQEDQAEFDVGGDIRLSPNRRIDSSMPEVFIATGHEMVDDVAISMPMLRRTTQLARTGGTEQFMMFDAQRSSQVVNIREDLAPDFDLLMVEVADLRPTMANILLPDDALDIGIVMAATEERSFPRRFTGPYTRVGFAFRVSAIVQDADGLLYKLRLGSIPVNVGRVRLEADLTYPLGDGTSATPRFPISLVDIELLSPVPSDKAHEVTVEIEGIWANLGDDGWERQETDMSPSAWDLDLSTVNRLFVQPEIDFTQANLADAMFLDINPEDLDPDSLQIDINTGQTFAGISPPLFFSIRPHGTELPETMPIVVSESFLETNATEVGERIRLVNVEAEQEAEILGTVVEFPTVGSDTAETVLIDLPTFQMMTYGPGVGLDLASEYWLSTTGDDDELVEAELLASPYDSARIAGVQSRTRALVTNPVALGTIGALTLGFVAAAVFATVGFAVSATVSARERLKEFALLRALGLSPKQLVSWLSLEQGVLVVLSLALGTLVGFVLTALVLPLVSLTQTGANTIPEVIILFPWEIVLKLELAVLAILGLTVLVMTALLRRIGLGSLLRLGDE